MKTNMKTQNKTIPTSQPKSDPKAIHTHRRITSNFRMIPHAISQSKELSFRDKGILLTLLSYPDDWIFHLDFISKEYGVGKDALKTSFRELVKRGYLRHVKVTGAHQRIVKYVWQVTNVPTDFVSINEHVVADSPPAVPPVTGFPASGESATTDRDRKTEKDRKKEKESKREDTMPPPGASIAPPARSTDQCNFISSNSFSYSFLSSIPKKYPELEAMTEDELRGTGFTEDQF